MRTDPSFRGDVRSSALWGRRGESRSNALWGRGGRGRVTLLALALVFVIPIAGSAATGRDRDGDRGSRVNATAIVPPSLLAAAKADPDKTFKVIVQGRRGHSSGAVSEDVSRDNGSTKKRFRSLSGVSAELRGKKILKLAERPSVLAITPDVTVRTSAYEDAEMWRQTADIEALYSGVADPITGLVGPAPNAPTIAIVDSGIDSSKVADFGNRLLANVNMSSRSSSTHDEEGHGTMVAGIAAGSSALYKGAAPTAGIVSLKTADANGESSTSDVIAAIDWILDHRQQYNIRVANFSMAGAAETSVRIDPLDKAVERLWFAGIVVVAAAGNHGTGSGPVSQSFAPANDPYVITVGATDQHSTSDPYDDDTPSWSAYGVSMDGFSKPDISAPGRYMVGPVPASSTLAQTKPERIVAPGYMWMSGTSFSTPVVAGAAAQILARHPDWTPDQVKGALMLTANYLPNAAGGVSGGVGEVDAAVAASLDFTPPDPNENLHAFEESVSGGSGREFNVANWAATVATQANWSQANWTQANWSSANWSQANWAAASWSQANWTSSLDGVMSSLASWEE